MNNQILLGLAFLFLIYQLTRFGQRFAQRSEERAELPPMPYLFPVLLMLGGAIFQAAIDFSWLKRWEISALCGFYLTVISCFQIHTMLLRKTRLLRSTAAQYLQNWALAVGMIFFLYRFVHLYATKSMEIDDSTLSMFLLGVLFILIGSAKLTLFENGIQLGFIFISWKKVRDWDWIPGKPGAVKVFTDSWLFPSLILVFNQDQKEEAEQLFWEKTIQEPAIIEEESDELDEEPPLETPPLPPRKYLEEEYFNPNDIRRKLRESQKNDRR